MTNQTIMEALDILADRAATYSLLSQMVREEPSVPFLQGLVNDLVLAEEPGEEAGEGYGLLRQFALNVQQASTGALSGSPSGIGQIQSELSIEYDRLFLASRQGRVHPFESVYTSAEGLLMQQARDDVLAAYREHGLARTATFNEPEDHLAVELEFMASLCQKTSGALTAGHKEEALALLASQATFLQKHLLVWVPRFCRDLAQATRSDFYRGVASLVEEHLVQEGTTIDELQEILASPQVSMTDP